LETVDLREKHPDIATDLEAHWLQWWREQSGKPTYDPESTKDSGHYRPQGDRGTGAMYQPTAMPAKLTDRYPIP
jgi:arylsulfatase